MRVARDGAGRAARPDRAAAKRVVGASRMRRVGEWEVLRAGVRRGVTGVGGFVAVGS